MTENKNVSPDLIEKIQALTLEAIEEAMIVLPDDVKNSIREASIREFSPVGRGELKNILENIRMAESLRVPLCQDTGIPVIYLTLPDTVPFSQSIIDAIYRAVREATSSVPLRPNLVDPISRVNSGDNTGDNMPPVHVKPGNKLSITVLPKGAGSENVSRIGMLLPSDKNNITRFVVETMLIAGSRPCPPVILGVGIGGTFDTAPALAKEALLMPISSMTLFELEICDAVNALGIGPMGLGGTITALAVKVRTAGCHTASLPVAVNIQCWASRRASREVRL